jgi:ABC-type Fe3+/spermidine/putrescine transport system ATPase subunit
MVRPERARLLPAPVDGALAARVEGVAFLGSASVVRVRMADGAPFELRTAERPSAAGLAPGDSVWIGWAPADAVVLDG